MKPFIPFPGRPFAQRQDGIALIVALVLLVAVTLLGISGIRNTSMQERMSGNMYDRSLAMQAAESALRAAEAALTANPSIGVNCLSIPCPIVPDTAFDGTDNNWVNVGTEYRVNNNLSAGIPQYYIQLMGEADDEEGLQKDDPACRSYSPPPGCGGPATNFYRITARSSIPSADNDRAIVVLQTTVRRSP